MIGQQQADRLDLGVAAEEGRQPGRQVVRRGVERADRREVGLQPVDDELPETLRMLEILEPMLAEVAQLDAVRQRVRRPATASRRRGAPGRRGRRWRSGWRGGRAGRHTSSPTGWPRRCGGRCGRGPPRRPATARRRAHAGRRPRRRPRPGADGKTAKNESPSVPTSTPPCASKAARSSSRWRSRIGGPSVAAAAKQPRRALDVAEQERDRSGEQLGHPLRSVRRDGVRLQGSATLRR